MYEFMKIEDEQHTALTLCLFLLSRLIACSLSAALRAGRCCIPAGRAALAWWGHPATPGTARGLRWEISPLPPSRKQHNTAEVMSKRDRDGKKVEICFTQAPGAQGRGQTPAISPKPSRPLPNMPAVGAEGSFTPLWPIALYLGGI